ncbi:MAG: hypothetical protein HQ567_18505 [Candidatus Nealsonbacteria bacterium]|nr:hypothetical protein [Candidatus Nealsonbacteria bacterium]
MLPVDIVLAPDWWFHHEGITFDEDFFFHPARRVEVERQMERVLHDRFGRFGLGEDHDRDLPVVGAVHLAAGYLISEMLGCRVDYLEDAPPQVVPANCDSLAFDADAAFDTPAFKRLQRLVDSLKAKYGRVQGDVNFSGILNIAMDLRGQTFLMDMLDTPEEASQLIETIGQVIERFTQYIAEATGSTSISVNRNVRHVAAPVFLHSECSHTMISVADYERFLLPLDASWSIRHRPFGIHYCGEDPHRYAESFARLPHLDFLDVGWPGDVAEIRRHLPDTFLNIRYSPVEIIKQTPDEIRRTVRRLVHDSANPYLTGVCCINMDQQVTDQQIAAIFEEVELLREEYAPKSA